MRSKFGAYATRSVPRYTSYPTAPHFTADIGPEDYRAWLADLDPSEAVSLYLHVPFCRQICWYCGCNMKLASKEGPILKYATDLIREIRLLARTLPGRMTCSHLHWGGGTPTALSSDALMLAMDTIRADFDFTENAEVAIESDPRTLSKEMIRKIGFLGFTRASFGVQEFDPEVQRAINRIQPPDMVRGAVEGFRAAGVSGINFDLIYGLPHQTMAKLSKTIDICADMRPDRIALFGYAHVPWMAKKQRMIDEATLPGTSERMEQAQMAAEKIVDAGYVAIGLDHFALPTDPLAIAASNGTLRRNFQGYTTDTATALLGLGASSIGRTPSGYVQSISEPGAWARSVRAGQLPIARGRALTRDDKLRAWVIEALMCRGTVDLDDAAAKFKAPKNWYSDVEDELAEMKRNGLITCDGARITISEGSASLVRVVASIFDAYLKGGAAKHSAAV